MAGLREIAALDIGTSKICCLIAAVEDDGRIRATGMSQRASAGIRNGTVTDMNAAYQAILAAVHAAEELAGTRIDSVVISLNAALPKSTMVERTMALAGGPIRDIDLRRLLQDARNGADLAERSLIHAIPIGFHLDGSPTIHDPRGMHGQNLAVRMHIVTAQTAIAHNLATCVARAHLAVSDMVIAPYAAGLSSLVEDEMDLGVTLVDMGGGTTSIAVFFEGAAIYTDVIPIGGHHVTNDIARGLSTPLAQAERIKTLFGSCHPTEAYNPTEIDIAVMGEEENSSLRKVTRGDLNRIIVPRLEETFEMIRAKLEQSGAQGIAGHRVVLTGGASQLPGVQDMAARLLSKQVRQGRPMRITGLAEAMSGPAFATAAGLLSFAVNNRGEARATKASQPTQGGGSFRRMLHWLKENL